MKKKTPQQNVYIDELNHLKELKDTVINDHDQFKRDIAALSKDKRHCPGKVDSNMYQCGGRNVGYITRFWATID